MAWIWFIKIPLKSLNGMDLVYRFPSKTEMAWIWFIKIPLKNLNGMDLVYKDSHRKPK